MLDITRIREESDKVKEAMKAKGEPDTRIVDQVLDTDKNWRDTLAELEKLRSETNTRSREIGRLMQSGQKEQAQEIIDETSQMKEQIKELEEKERELREQREQQLEQIPNMAHESVPVGTSEDDNQVYKIWGEPVSQAWRKPHWELGEEYGWMDFQRGAKVTSAGFPFFRGRLARLQRGLVNFFIDQALEKGYEELQAPYLVNEDSARGTGQVPDKEGMMYVIPRDGYYAIPTAEVPVTNFHRDELFHEKQLPVNYVCYTPCWRREAGSHGADVRGLNRLHQFDKVELVKFVHPDHSYDELERLRQDAEQLLEKLEIPYRTLLMCTADMGFTQSKKYDLEAWSPGQEKWLEVSSCSNFEDYQARRMQIRMKTGGGDTRPIHTLNGSGLALPRVISALIETYQLESGGVTVPEVLRPYIGMDQI